MQYDTHSLAQSCDGIITVLQLLLCKRASNTTDAAELASSACRVLFSCCCCLLLFLFGVNHRTARAASSINTEYGRSAEATHGNVVQLRVGRLALLNLQMFTLMQQVA
jgi:hypothetical protein